MIRFLIAAGAALLVCDTAQAQSHFTFTEQLDSGPLMTGTFDGLLSGDIITNLSNINVFMDNVAYQGNGSLVGMHYDEEQFLYVTGGAVASLDGQHNNFLFADVDTNLATPANYYSSLFDAQSSAAYAWRGPITSPISGYGPVRFHAIELAVPEPASWALMVGGFALAGLGLRSQRRTIRFA